MILLLNIVKNAFCPDLLHSCPTHSTNSNSSSSSDPTQQLPDEDYVEIDEIRQTVSKLSIHNNDPFNTNSTNFPHPFAKDNATCIAPIEPSKQAMGQSLTSQRRPRISLTWVLRGEHQPANPSALLHRNNDGSDNRTHEKKKFRSKSKDTGERLFSEKYVTEHEKIGDPNLNNNRQRAVSELLFVCSKNAGENSTVDGYASDQCGGSRNERCRRSEKTKVSSKFSLIKNNLNNFSHEKSEHFKDKTIALNGENGFRNGNDVNGEFIKPTYSEPSLCTDGQSRRHRHRRRRERNRSQRFGYEIRNVDEFLSKVRISLLRMKKVCVQLCFYSVKKPSPTHLALPKLPRSIFISGNFVNSITVLVVIAREYSSRIVVIQYFIPDKAWWIPNRNSFTFRNGCKCSFQKPELAICPDATC